jgi:hypothetical protein
MARGRTNSSLSLGARKQKAVELFTRGWTPSAVAAEIGVTVGTAKRYHDQYEQDIAEQARAHPNLLREVVKNTIGALAEIEQLRQEAWRNYEDTANPQTRVAFLNTARAATADKHKVLQLFGVKAEYMAQVAVIQANQQKLLEFLAGHAWCDDDKLAVIEFLEHQINGDVLDFGATNLPPAPVDVVDR